MVDAGEVINKTLRREFGEETLNTLSASPEEKKQIEKDMNNLFAHGAEVRNRLVGCWIGSAS